jgi:hypothetical protein
VLKVVVAIVGERVVTNNVDRDVGYYRSGSRGAEDKCKQRPQSYAHDSGLLRDIGASLGSRGHASFGPQVSRAGAATRPSGSMRRSNALMNKRARVLRAIFRGIARLQRSFTIEVGPLRASGVPAILVGVTGIILASGVTAALAKGASRLPETLGEARNLADALNAGSPRLKS